MNAPILIAEDDPDDLFLVCKALRQIDEQIDVVSVRNGKELLSELQAGLKPAAILLDLNMPVLDGREVLSELQTMRPPIAAPVYVLTTSSEESERRQCLRRGAQGFIPKPMTVRSYVSVLQPILQDKWHDARPEANP